MPDAKGVEGPQPRPSLLRAAAARRPVRKPGEGPPAAGSGTIPPPAAPVATPAPAAPRAPQAPPPEDRADRADRPERPTRTTVRLDDLYRMPMPQLFKLAEKEGI